MRLLRWLELALASGLSGLVLIAGWVHPSFATGPPPASRPPVRPAPLAQPGRPGVRLLIVQAAQRHGIRPALLLAVADWESGFDQSRVSDAGAVGIMQVEPDTARLIGPGLNVHDPADNVELGARILKEDLDNAGGDEALALASYNEGPTQAGGGIDAEAQAYIDGVEALAGRFESGEDPAQP